MLVNLCFHEEFSVLVAGHLNMPLRIILAGLCQFNLNYCQPSLVGDNRKVKFNLKNYFVIFKREKIQEVFSLHTGTFIFFVGS